MKRIIGYDLARALAIFGMVIVNFKIVMGAESNGPDWLKGLVSLLDGRAAATFVVLAGAGIALLSQKARLSGDRDRLKQNRNTLLKRALFLFVVGLMYTPLWPADILHFYGVYIAVAALLLAMPVQKLWGYAGALIVGFAVMFFNLDYEAGWNWETLEYAGFWTFDGMVRHILFNGFHPVIPWLAFLLIGMIIGRQDMANPAVRKKTLYWGLGIAVFAEVISRVLIVVLTESPAELEEIQAVFGTSPMPPLPLYMLAGSGTAVAIISIMISIGEKYENAPWITPLVSTGQLALTLYVAHVVIGMGTLEAIGRLENQTLAFSLLASLVFCVLSIVFSHFWRKRFKRGPLEIVMRKLT